MDRKCKYCDVSLVNIYYRKDKKNKKYYRVWDFYFCMKCRRMFGFGNLR